MLPFGALLLLFFLPLSVLYIFFDLLQGAGVEASKTGWHPLASADFFVTLKQTLCTTFSSEKLPGTDVKASSSCGFAARGPKTGRFGGEEENGGAGCIRLVADTARL